MKVFFLSSTAHNQSFGKVLEHLLEKDDRDILAYNKEHITHIASLRGHPQPPTAKPLKGVGDGICELRLLYDVETLLRIYYFVDKEKDAMVLMNVIMKPDGCDKATHYEGSSKKKIDRQIKQSIELAKELKMDYLTSHYDYEEYPL